MKNVETLFPLACPECPWGDVFPHLWAMPDGHFHCLTCAVVVAVSDVVPNLSACEVWSTDSDGRLGYVVRHASDCLC